MDHGAGVRMSVRQAVRSQDTETTLTHSGEKAKEKKVGGQFSKCLEGKSPIAETKTLINKAKSYDLDVHVIRIDVQDPDMIEYNRNTYNPEYCIKQINKDINKTKDALHKKYPSLKTEHAWCSYYLNTPELLDLQDSTHRTKYPNSHHG